MHFSVATLQETDSDKAVCETKSRSADNRALRKPACNLAIAIAAALLGYG